MPDAIPPSSSFAPPYPALGAAAGAPLYLTGEDALVLTVFNGAAGVTVTAAGRTLPFGGTKPSKFGPTLTPATNRTPSTLVIAVGDGWLLGVQVLVTGGSPLVGQTYAKLSLVRSATAGRDEHYTLAAGYVTAQTPIAWPGVGAIGALEGAGALRSITGSAPGAGAEISEVVPTAARWALLAFEADLTTSAAAANRVPELTIDDGATVYARSPVNNNETASQTWRNSFQQGIPQIYDATRFRVLQPIGCELVIGAGHRIKTVTANIQAGDAWGAPQYLVREWIEA